MNTFTSQIRQNCGRLIFICGLLVGLFFSGGEGVRLLPFPAPEGKDHKLAVSSTEGNPKAYALSVFSPRTFFALLKSKFQKDTGQSVGGAHFAFARSESVASFVPSAPPALSATGFLRLSARGGSQSDRAPPPIRCPSIPNL